MYLQCRVWCWVWVFGLGVAGTVSHMGGHSWLPMRLVGVVGVVLCHPLILVSRDGSPSPLIPLPSRERGIGWCCLVSPSDPSVKGCVTLTFDSSRVKGEGDSVGCVGLLLPRVTLRPSGLRTCPAIRRKGWLCDIGRGVFLGCFFYGPLVTHGCFRGSPMACSNAVM